jgi:hypothetical protein
VPLGEQLAATINGMLNRLCQRALLSSIEKKFDNAHALPPDG